MIELKDINVRSITGFGMSGREVSLLKEIDSVDEALDVIECYPELDWKMIQKRIAQIKKNLERLDHKEIYRTNGYSILELNDIDEMNNGNILLLKTITQCYTKMYTELDILSIKEIKKLLLFVDEFGNNYLRKILHSVGSNGINRIIDAINMYEEQVERQYQICGLESNIFIDRLDIRKELVEVNLKKIIEYFCSRDNSSLVWGSLSDKQKQLYQKLISSKSDKKEIIKMKLINYLALYLTIPELENIEKGNVLVLNRFIKEIL